MRRNKEKLKIIERFLFYHTESSTIEEACRDVASEIEGETLETIRGFIHREKKKDGPVKESWYRAENYRLNNKFRILEMHDSGKKDREIIEILESEDIYITPSRLRNYINNRNTLTE